MRLKNARDSPDGVTYRNMISQKFCCVFKGCGLLILLSFYILALIAILQNGGENPS
jgi:hypothetical protein